MMQIRIGVTIATSAQLECVARLSREHGAATVHVTSEPYLYIHDAKAESVPGMLEALLVVGFSPGDGEGASVNVKACPRAGSCPRECFNVAPYALAVAAYLQSSGSPHGASRKHKVAFSGCPSDCALAAVADLGFSAQVREGSKGFSVRVGGGLGPPPAIGVQVEAFVPDSEVLPVVEAVQRLLDRHASPTDRDNAPIRNVVESLGEDEFVRRYRAERVSIGARGLACDVLMVTGKVSEIMSGSVEDVDSKQSSFETDVEGQEQSCVMKVTLSQGEISAGDLGKVSQVAHSYGAGFVCVTPCRDLLIPHISPSQLGVVRDVLRGLDLSV